MKAFLLVLSFCIITLIANSQQITATNSGITSVCTGKSVSVAFTTSGFSTTGRTFTAQLSDVMGGFLNPVVLGTAATSPIIANIPVNVSVGSAYKIRVVTNTTGITYNPTTVFSINTTPTAVLSGSKTIFAGDSTALTVVFTGFGPWTYTFTNTATGIASTSPLNGFVKPSVSTTYQLQSVSNGCGTGSVSGSAVVTVLPKLNMETLPQTICHGVKFDIKFSTGTAPNATISYQAQLSDSLGNFTKPTIIGTSTSSPIAAIIPVTTFVGSSTKYKIRLMGSNNTSVISEAFGVSVLPSAIVLGGNPSLKFGDEAIIIIQFGGTPPWTYELSDGKTGTLSVSPATIGVIPETTTTYSLQSVKNVCGLGTTAGKAEIKVVILGINNESKNEVLTFYPNPAKNEVLILENNKVVEVAEWNILDINGLLIKSSKNKTISIDDLPIGTYFLKVQTNGRWVSRKLVKQ